jgi:hypothetical protein
MARRGWGIVGNGHRPATGAGLARRVKCGGIAALSPQSVKIFDLSFKDEGTNIRELHIIGLTQFDNNVVF